ncbi:MAG: bifunctional nicotinamide-nucleotide adenylyltransferase/Nudix hydroxylase [Azoarcus sp.]|jgi:bifunctional NMN adenylyltransferase/nudix hydrolase|nr:bifunctional nicotinamide-nucleotide adenylyltransferase/Nudix hydroxylase [Azoarcus sp.]
MSANFDAAVLIGRFQPFHKGHAALLKQALEIADRALIVLGSAYRSRNAKNPFTWEERAAMIAATLDEGNDGDARRVVFIPVRDYYDDGRWSAAVAREVRKTLEKTGIAHPHPRIALTGFHKDDSSYYLKLFPQWSFIASAQQGDIDATAIRQIYFGESTETTEATETESESALQNLVPPAVARILTDWAAQPAFAAMREEHRAIEAYKKKWGAGPFVTLDAVVTMAEPRHVLLVRRGNTPGKGLWAIPGGFLEGRERLLQGAIRELKEETGLGIADATLTEALREVAVFDHPDRSQRGRIITHAHWFDLSRTSLPPVAGADDAAEARWFPVAALPGMEAELFGDHFAILNRFLALYA